MASALSLSLSLFRYILFFQSNRSCFSPVRLGMRCTGRFRRYMGHKRTIRPNAKKLSSLFKALKQMGWDTFARKVKACQRGFMGEPDEMRPGRGEFHEFPSSCICRKPDEPKIGEHSKKPA